MFNTLISLFKNKDIRNKILFTLAMLFVFRLGAAITVPNIDTSKLVTGLSGNDLITMMNMLGIDSKVEGLDDADIMADLKFNDGSMSDILGAGGVIEQDPFSINNQDAEK